MKPLEKGKIYQIIQNSFYLQPRHAVSREIVIPPMKLCQVKKRWVFYFMKVYPIFENGRLTLYLVCQFWALPIQRKNIISKIWTNGVKLSD